MFRIVPRPENEIDWREVLERSSEDSEIRRTWIMFKEIFECRGLGVEFSEDGMELRIISPDGKCRMSYWAETILSVPDETRPGPEFLEEGAYGPQSFHIGAVVKPRPKQEIDWRERVEKDPEVHRRLEEFRELWRQRGFQLEFSNRGMILEIYREDKRWGSWWAESVLDQEH